MPVSVFHSLTATTPDNTSYEIRPSHWNSLHVGTISATAGTEIFGAFSNDPTVNVSFSTNAGGKVIASANVTAAPSPVNVTGNGSSVNAQTIAFTNSNGLTLGVSTAANAATITGSYTVPSTAGLLSAINFSAGTTSNNLSAITFSNSNGLAFGLNASTVTGSYTVPTVTNSSWTVSDANTSAIVGRLAFTQSNGLTLSLSTSNNGQHTVIGSYTVPATAGLISGLNVSGGAGNSQSNVSGITFSNSNGLTFGVSTGANVVTVTASYTVPTQTNQTESWAATSNTAGNTSGMSVDARSITLAGYGIASVGFSTSAGGSSVVVSATQSNQAVSAQGGSSAFQTLIFTNSNNVSFSNTGGSVWGSYALNISATGGTSNAISGLTFKDGGGISFGVSTGAGVATVTATVAAGAATGISSIAASGGTQTVGMVSFINSNNITFGMSTGANTGSVTASYALNVSATGGTSNALSGLTFKDSNGVSFGLSTGAGVGTITATVAAQSNQTIGGYFVNNTTGASSTSTVDARSVSFTLGGAMSGGWTGGTIELSVPQTSSLVGVNGISVSTNGSTISVSYSNIMSTYVPDWPASTNTVLINTLGVSSANPVFFPFQVDEYVSFNVIRMMESYSYVTSSSAASLTQRVQFGLYSNNASTWSQISSGVSSLLMTNSGVSGTVSFATATGTGGYTYSTSGFSSTATGESLFGNVGYRVAGMQFGGNMSLSPGFYAIGLLSTASSSSANVGINQWLVGNVVPVSSLFNMGVSVTATNEMLGMGYGTATSASLPASMAFSNMTNSLGVIPLLTLQVT